MTGLRSLVNRLDWLMVGLLCATVGLAPFVPQPHVWEKLQMLADGRLTRPIDILDLLFHGLPWVLLILKAVWSRKTEH